MGLSARNKLAFPTGFSPGINPNHPASPGLVLSAFFSGQSLYDFQSGTPGFTFGNANVPITDNIIGPAVRFPTATNASIQWSTPLLSGVTPTQFTVAGMLKMTTIGTSRGFILDNGNNNGVSLNAAGGAFRIFLLNNVDSTIIPIAGVPYFFCASINAGATYLVVRRLDNGQIFTASLGAGGSGVVFQSPFHIGDNASGVSQLDGSIGAVMWSTAFLSMQQLTQWADDPWSFWYPDADESFPVVIPGSSIPSTSFIPLPRRPIFRPGRGPGATVYPSKSYAFTATLNANLTGVSVVADSVGSLGIIILPTFSGVSSGSGTGTFLLSDGPNLTGVSDSTAAAISLSEAIAESGGSQVSTAGTLFENIAPNLIGGSDVTSLGSFFEQISFGITGVSDTTNAAISLSELIAESGGSQVSTAGALFEQIAPKLTGTLNSSTLGSLFEQISFGITGASDTTNAGLTFANLGPTLSGVSDLTSLGSFFESIAFILNGVSDSTLVGNLSIPQPLGGGTLTSNLGTLGISEFISALGVPLSLNTSQFVIGISPKLSGVSSSASAGSLFIPIPISGTSLTSISGLFGISELISLVGVTSSLKAGLFIPTVSSTISTSLNSTSGIFLNSETINTLNGILTLSKAGRFTPSISQSINVSLTSLLGNAQGHEPFGVSLLSGLGNVTIIAFNYFFFDSHSTRAKLVIVPNTYNANLILDGTRSILALSDQNLMPFIMTPEISIKSVMVVPKLIIIPNAYNANLILDGTRSVLALSDQNLMPIIMVPVTSIKEIVINPRFITQNNNTIQIG